MYQIKREIINVSMRKHLPYLIDLIAPLRDWTRFGYATEDELEKVN